LKESFPDPFPPAGKAKKRLTSPKFLEIYRKVLRPNGMIHLKTDNSHQKISRYIPIYVRKMASSGTRGQ